MSLLLLALAMATPLPQGAVLLDGVAAVVEREVITRSDVERFCRMAMARRGVGLLAVDLPIDDGLRAAALEQLVVEEMVLVDARHRDRLPDVDVDAQKRAAQFGGLFNSQDDLRQFLLLARMSEGELLERMRREARVDILLAQRMAEAFSDDDVAARIQGDAALRAMALAAAREQARQELMVARGRDAVKTWVAALRARTSVKVVAQYGAAPP